MRCTLGNPDGRVVTAPPEEAPSTCIGIFSPGSMGAGIGWALREGGARVVATVAGRSPRTARLAAVAGLELLPDLAEVVRVAQVILVVTPPAEAVDAAHQLAETISTERPIVADLNATAPATVAEVARILAPVDLVDGSISGAPPTVRPGARIYLSGPRAHDVAALPWTHATPVVDDRVGSASAVKMCTASVYKGLVGLYAQALRTAGHHGVLDRVVADLAASGLGGDPARSVAVAATKAWRYVPEMREIAATQRAAGLTPALFEAYAQVWADVAGTELAGGDPESVDPRLPIAEIVERLRPTR